MQPADDRHLRCPDCRSFDWYRDGFAMHELPDGGIVRQRLTDSADQETPWSCTQCGHEVQPHTLLRGHLDVAAAVELDRPQVAASFAREADAAAALQRASAVGAPVDVALRQTTGKRGEARTVVEARCAEPGTCARVESILLGAHGIPLPPEDPVPIR